VHRAGWRAGAASVVASATLAVPLMLWASEHAQEPVGGFEMVLGGVLVLIAASLAVRVKARRKIRALVCADGIAWLRGGGGEETVRWQDIATVSFADAPVRLDIETRDHRRIALPGDLDDVAGLRASLEARRPARAEKLPAARLVR
jgi:hypothetical protein